MFAEEWRDRKTTERPVAQHFICLEHTSALWLSQNEQVVRLRAKVQLIPRPAGPTHGTALPLDFQTPAAGILSGSEAPYYAPAELLTLSEQHGDLYGECGPAHAVPAMRRTEEAGLGRTPVGDELVVPGPGLGLRLAKWHARAEGTYVEDFDALEEEIALGSALGQPKTAHKTNKTAQRRGPALHSGHRTWLK